MEPGSGIVKNSAGWRAGTGRALGAVLDLVYPPTCLGCKAPTARADGLCADCWRQLQPITAPLCPRLGLPFAVDLGPEALSAQAIADPPPFDRARAAFVYSEMSRRMVTRLKYGDRPDLAPFCARSMIAAAPELLQGDPVLVPVPLHRWRLLKRRYNQSLELARALGRLGGLAVAPGLVKRTRPTRQQVGLTAEQRARNVRNAFAVDLAEAARLSGRRLVIVDDVMTTGATAKAVTKALHKAGFDHIDVITFARVAIGVETTI